jgi:hypothetical protein
MSRPLHLFFLWLPAWGTFASQTLAQTLWNEAGSNTQARIEELHFWRARNPGQQLFYNCALALAYERQFRETPLAQRERLKRSADSTHHYYQLAQTNLDRPQLRRNNRGLKTLFGRAFDSPTDLRGTLQAAHGQLRGYRDSVTLAIASLDQALHLYQTACRTYQGFVKGFKDDTELYLNGTNLSMLALDSVRQYFGLMDNLLATYRALGKSASLGRQQTRVQLVHHKGSVLAAAQDCASTYGAGANEILLLDFRRQAEKIRYKIQVQLPALKKGQALADLLLNKALARYYEPNSANRAGLAQYQPTLERQVVDSLRLFDKNALSANLLDYKIKKLEALHTIYHYQRARATESLDLAAQVKAERQIIQQLGKCDQLLSGVQLSDRVLANYLSFVESPYQGKNTVEEFMILEKQQLYSLTNGWRLREAETFAKLVKLGRHASYGAQQMALYPDKNEVESLLAEGWLVSLHTYELPQGERFAAGYHQPPGQPRMAFGARVNAKQQVRWLTYLPAQGGAPKQLFVVADQSGWASLATRNEANQAQSLLLDPSGKETSASQVGLVASAFNPQSHHYLQVEHTDRLRCHLVNAPGQTIATLEMGLVGTVVGAVPDGDGFALIANFASYTEPSGRRVVSEAFRTNGTNVVLFRLGIDGKLRETIPFTSHNTLFATEIFQPGNKSWVVRGWQSSDPLKDPAVEQGTSWTATFKTK